LNALLSTSATAIPSAPLVTPVLKALTISLTLLFCEPVHWYEQPSSLHASSAPQRVRTKNGFVVTWLTNTNFIFGFDLKMPLAGEPPDDWAAALPELLSSLLPQAASTVATSPAAPPVSAVRRVTDARREWGVCSCLASCHSSRSRASWSGSRFGAAPS